MAVVDRPGLAGTLVESQFGRRVGDGVLMVTGVDRVEGLRGRDLVILLVH